MFYKCNAFARWYIAKALDVCKLAGLKVDAEALTYFVYSKVLQSPFKLSPDISVYQKSLGFEIPPEAFIKGKRPTGTYYINMMCTVRRGQKQKYTFTVMRLGTYLAKGIISVEAPKNIRPWLEAGLCNIIERRGYEQYDTPY